MVVGVSELLSFASRILDQEKRQVENTDPTCRSCIMYMLLVQYSRLPKHPHFSSCKSLDLIR